jgi:hypothetical protein
MCYVLMTVVEMENVIYISDNASAMKDLLKMIVLLI